MSHCALSRLAAPIGQDVSIVHCPAAAALPLVTGQAAQPAPPRQHSRLLSAGQRLEQVIAILFLIIFVSVSKFLVLLIHSWCLNSVLNVEALVGAGEYPFRGLLRNCEYFAKFRCKLYQRHVTWPHLSSRGTSGKCDRESAFKYIL